MFADRFPKSVMLKRWLPSGILKVTAMVFVGRWWATLLGGVSEDPSTQLQVGFVVLGFPALVLTILGWFAGGPRAWRSTPVSKVLGVATLALWLATVSGFLFS